MTALSLVLPGNHGNCIFSFPRPADDSHRPHGIMHITTASVVPLSITFYHKKKHISNFNLPDKLIESGINATLASKTCWLHIIIEMILRHWSGTAFARSQTKLRSLGRPLSLLGQKVRHLPVINYLRNIRDAG